MFLILGRGQQQRWLIGHRIWERGSRAGEAKTGEKSSQTDDAREKSSIGPMDLAMRIYSITTRSNPKDKVGE